MLLRRLLGAVLLSCLSAGAWAGCWAWAFKVQDVAASAAAAKTATARPRGKTDAAKIRKFIAENPF